MSNFKIKIIFLNIILFFSLCAQAHECREYFKKSDFAQSYSLSMKDFRLLESLANIEISASGIRDPISKSASLEDVSTKLAELLQAGVSINTYPDIKKIILKEIRRRNEREEKRARKQEQQLEDSRINGTRAVFHRIEPGSFLMGKEGQHTTITQAFELMATQTTQIIWKKIAELINNKLSGKYTIKTDPSRFKGDLRPVESVSLDDIQNWIDALNELSQLGEPSLAKLIQGHKKGDVYRLPWEMEWEFVIRGRGKYNDIYHFGDKESELKEYAWFAGNSGNETHPVAQKKPLVIDGYKEFFDMHGNVWEWTADRWDEFSPLPGGLDPMVKDGPYGVVRGGGWNNPAIGLLSGNRSECDLARSNNLGSAGFRLLRIVN